MKGPRLLRWLSRVNDLFARAAGVAAGALLVAMTSVVGAGVFFRYVLNDSLVWSEEATRYLAIWLVFLGVGLAHRWGRHVRIGLLVERLPGRRRHVGEFVVEGAVMVILAAIAWFGWELAQSVFGRGQLSSAMGIRIGWIYLAVPVGLGLALLQSLERALWSAYALVTGQAIPPITFARTTQDEIVNEAGQK